MSEDQLAFVQGVASFREYVPTKPFALEDETSESAELYDFLDDNQRHTAEVLGLRIDGCSALVRNHFIHLLDIDSETVEKLDGELIRRRSNEVSTRIRAAFAGATQEGQAYLNWQARSDSIEFNLWALALLSKQQKWKLAEIINESAVHNEAVQAVVLACLGTKQDDLPTRNE